MSSDLQPQNRASDEAAAWFARMNASSISTAELGEFRTWRQNSINDAAYRAVSGLWRESEPLKSDPDILAAVSAARARTRPRQPKHWGWFLSGAVGLGAVGLGALSVVGIFGGTYGADHVYQTAVGQQRTFALEDGSRVRLDTDSRVRVRFTPRERLITLVQGQAFFDVVHHVNRPLLVRVGDTLIRDLGTRFDVRRDMGQVRITVIEGSVEVGAPLRPAGWTLTAGQQMVAGGQAQAPYPVDLVKATSWTSGRLIFEDISLTDATAEMNRYGQHKLILRASSVGEVKVNGAFDSSDTSAFVAAVTRLYNLKAVAQPDGSIVLTDDAGVHPG